MPGVVHIELPPHVPAGEVQHGGHGVPQDAAPGVSDGHGTGGVCGDEFHHDALAVSLFRAAVVGPLGEDGGEHVGVPAVAQAEVEEARPRGLGAGEPGAAQVHGGEDVLRDLPGRGTEGLGPRHGMVRGKVAVLAVFRQERGRRP